MRRIPAFLPLLALLSAAACADEPAPASVTSPGAGPARASLVVGGGYRGLYIGSLGGAAFPLAVNARKQVVGYSYLDGGTVQHAFLWDGEMRDLGTLPGYPSSIAMGINEQGVIVGMVSGGTGSPESRAVMWTREGDRYHIRDIFDRAGRSARDVNERGEILGDERVWSPTRGMISLPRPPGFCDFASQAALSDSGWVAGHSCTGGVLWAPSGQVWAYQLGTQVSDVNNHRLAVGGSTSMRGGFVYDSVLRFSDPPPGFLQTGAMAVNDAGVMAGGGIVTGGALVALLWTDPTAANPVSLGGLFPAGSDTYAADLNERGDVAGHWQSPDGLEHSAILWTRDPPPGLPAAPAPPAGTTDTVTFDRVPVRRGETVEGLGRVNPRLRIRALYHRAVLVEEGSSPEVYLSGERGRNGCMPGRRGFSDAEAENQRARHGYEFTFAPGVRVSSFSVMMLDYGDFIQGSSDPVKAVLLRAYDAAGNQVAKHELVYRGTPAVGGRGSACLDGNGQLGRYTFRVQAPGIVRVRLEQLRAYDPAVGFDNVYFTVEPK